MTAIDAAADRVAEIRNRAAAEGVPLRAEQWNLLQESPERDAYDIVLLIGVVEYAGLWNENRDVEGLQVTTLQTALAMLKPGGTLILGTKSRWWPPFVLRDVHTRQALVNVLPRGAAERLSRGTTGAPYRRYIHSPRRWRALIERAGFAEVETFFPYFSYQFPVCVVKRPGPGDWSRLRPTNGETEVRAVTHGRGWWVKALLMMAARAIGVPLSHSVILVARKPMQTAPGQ